VVSCFSRPLWRSRWEVGGRGPECFLVWREVGRIRDGDGDIGGGWFGDSVRRRVGDGAETLFWSHRWIVGSPLCKRFPCLFDLAENKTITVASLFSMGMDQGGEGWRRRLWAWEEALLEECRRYCLISLWFLMFQIYGSGFLILQRGIP
jgi:hypothetical protein